jgi:hypothetical protein
LVYIWFLQPTGSAKTIQDLPYLGSLFASLIIEAAGVVILFVKSGLRYLPKVETVKTEAATFQFMCDYVKNGTSVTIVSNRLSLLTQSPDFYKEILKGAKVGRRFEIITPNLIGDDIRKPLTEAGVVFFVTNEAVAPDARFTLINGERKGAERLAIARGTHPDHEITIFDSNSGPQMIAMAKDIIRKSKRLADAPQMG